MATLKYDFSVVNAKAIDRAFASIEQRAVRHNLKMAQAFGGPGTRSTRAPSSRSATYGPTRATMLKGIEKQRIAQERAVQREQSRTARQAARNEKYLQGIRNRHYQQEERNRRKAEAASHRAAARAHAERRRTTGALFGRVGGSVSRTTRAVGATIGGTLAIGGGFMASAAIGQQMRETAMASQLANQAGTPGIKRQLLRESQSVRGFTGEEVMGGMGAFMDLTGDIDSARKLFRGLAEVSLATGAEFEDMNTLAGNLSNSLSDIEDPGKRAAKVMETIRALGRQGELGAVEVKHMAAMGGSLSAIATGIGGDQGMALRKAGALAQIAKRSSRSPEEAMTAAQNFVDAIGQKSGKIEEKFGIRDAFVKSADGANVAIKDPKKLIGDLFEKTGGDIGTLTKLLGRRGQRVTKSFADIYQKEGRSGINRVFDELTTAQLSEEQVTDRAASRLADPDLQLKEVLRDFNAQVGEQLLPIITKLIPEFAKLLPHVQTAARIFGKLIEAVAENPLLTIGQMIAAKVALDIASARIGETIKSGLTGAFSGGGGGDSGDASVATSKGRGMNIGRAVFNGVSIGTAAAMTIMATGVVNFEAAEAQMDQAGGRVREAREIYGAMKSGDITPQAAADQLKAIFGEQRSEVDKVAERNVTNKSTASSIDSILNAVLPGWMTGDVVSKDTPNGIVGGSDGIATSVAETLGFINESQQKTNEKFEKSIQEMLNAARQMSNSADKLSEAGDKLGSGGSGGVQNRPPAPSI